ncbi:MAG: hypothetical protein IKP69_09695 [Oscillospiraceae bacterium]|nr:hypothetical protein [Oscillospiraceae bacterium]
MTRKQKIIIISSIVIFLLLAFIYAAGSMKEGVYSVYNGTLEDVADAYDITLDESAHVESFERYYYFSNEAYVLKITDISDINTWCQMQKNWNVKELDNSFMLLDNQRYMYQSILKTEDCVYVVSLDNNIENVVTKFYDLYS